MHDFYHPQFPSTLSPLAHLSHPTSTLHPSQVINNETDKNWFKAEQHGQSGFIPANYVTLLPHPWMHGKITRVKAEEVLLVGENMHRSIHLEQYLKECTEGRRPLAQQLRLSFPIHRRVFLRIVPTTFSRDSLSPIMSHLPDKHTHARTHAQPHPHPHPHRPLPTTGRTCSGRASQRRAGFRFRLGWRTGKAYMCSTLRCFGTTRASIFCGW